MRPGCPQRGAERPGCAADGAPGADPSAARPLATTLYQDSGWAWGFCFDRQAAIHLVEDLTQELQAGYISGRRPVSLSQKRILITGCPIGGVLDKTVKAIEEKGGVVVCFENCSGMKAALQMVDTQAEDMIRPLPPAIWKLDAPS